MAVVSQASPKSAGQFVIFKITEIRKRKDFFKEVEKCSTALPPKQKGF